MFTYPYEFPTLNSGSNLKNSVLLRDLCRTDREPKQSYLDASQIPGAWVRTTEFSTIATNICSIIAVVFPYIQKRLPVHMQRAESARKDRPRYEVP